MIRCQLKVLALILIRAEFKLKRSYKKLFSNYRYDRINSSPRGGGGKQFFVQGAAHPKSGPDQVNMLGVDSANDGLRDIFQKQDLHLSR